MSGMRGAGAVPAYVLGDVDLIAALGRAGIRSVAVLDPADPARFSRFVLRTLDKPDHWRDRERLVAELLAAARPEPAPPVLYYQADGDLLTVSRHRQVLATGFRFVVADAELVEDLVDKARFGRLARRLDLPVPPARALDWRQGPEPALELTFPLVLKPLTRDGLAILRAHGLRIAGKALRVDVPTQLTALWPRLRAARVPVLAQALIPGPESRIESYHAYVDDAGRTVGEFAGEKVRTYPAEYGDSTLLRLSVAPDVLAAGRDIVARLGLRGVVKLDLKRDHVGRLWLLEVNPRFTLWHHLAAAAGLNLPALVYADLTGRPRAPVAAPRPGARWCDPIEDRYAARAVGVGRLRWAVSVLGCAARAGADLDDPMPFLRGMLWPRVAGRAGRIVAGAGRRRAAAGAGHGGPGGPGAAPGGGT